MVLASPAPSSLLVTKPGEIVTKCGCGVTLLHKLQGRVIRCPECKSVVRFTSGLTPSQVDSVCGAALYSKNFDVRGYVKGMNLDINRPSLENVLTDMRLNGFYQLVDGTWTMEDGDDPYSIPF